MKEPWSIPPDWEATGADEMNRLYQHCKERPNCRIYAYLEELRDLVDICGDAALYSDDPLISGKVGRVLSMFVSCQINRIKQELAK